MYVSMFFLWLNHSSFRILLFFPQSYSYFTIKSTVFAQLGLAALQLYSFKWSHSTNYLIPPKWSLLPVSIDILLMSILDHLKCYFGLVYFQPDDVVNVATDKINNLLESFMGINDTELGKTKHLQNTLYLIFSCAAVPRKFAWFLIQIGIPICSDFNIHSFM